MGEGLVCHRIYKIIFWSTTQGYLQDRGGVWGVGVGVDGGEVDGGSITKDLCMGILLVGTGVALITEPCR